MSFRWLLSSSLLLLLVLESAVIGVELDDDADEDDELEIRASDDSDSCNFKRRLQNINKGEDWVVNKCMMTKGKDTKKVSVNSSCTIDRRGMNIRISFLKSNTADCTQ